MSCPTFTTYIIPIAQFFDEGIIDRFDAKLQCNASKFSLSIISSSIGNTGGLGLPLNKLFITKSNYLQAGTILSCDK